MSLSNKDASIVLGMLARGDDNHDIAAWFGVNPARIAEIKDGVYGSLSAAPVNLLPPKGAVGPKARRLRAYVDDAVRILSNERTEGIDAALKELQTGLQSFDRNEV